MSAFEELLVNRYLSGDIMQINRANIERLKSRLSNRRKSECVFVLGAGATIKAGMPDWDSLLEEIFSDIVPALLPLSQKRCDDVQTFLRSLRHTQAGSGKQERINVLQGINYLEQAEYITDLLDLYLNDKSYDFKTRMVMSRAMMARIVSEALKIYYKEHDICDGGWKVVDELIAFVKNGLIKQIVNYCFDDLLEHRMTEPWGIKYKTFGLRDCVYREPGKYDCMIYHVHGKTPVLMSELDDTDKNNRHKRSAGRKWLDDGLIFNEQSYYSLENEVYNMSNTCQAQALSSCHGVFVGVSLQDYSMRRIIMKGKALPPSVLETIDSRISDGKSFYSERETEALRINGYKEHYILQPINKLLSKLDIKHDSEIGFNCGQKESLDMFLRFQTDYMLRRGFATIYTTYDDIHCLLEIIRDNVNVEKR